MIRDRGTRGDNTNLQRAEDHPLESALPAVLLTVALFCVVLGILRPGYWINDDLKIAWLLSGYPEAGGPGPFPVYSNVLIGLLLLPFFKHAGALNWFSILLTFANALAAVVFLHLAISRNRRGLFRFIGCATVLLALALLILELSFTISAFISSLAGICLIWASVQHTKPNIAAALGGVALIAFGSMIRLQMLAIAAVIALPSILVSGVRWRPLVVALAAAGLAALAGYGFDRLYTRASPDWNLFYAYTHVRQTIHDSHRLFNVHGQIRRVGWTPNDQELFARWFYPDKALYSFEHLRYLQDNVSASSQNPLATLEGWLPGMVGGRNGPFLVVMLGMIAFSFAMRLSMRTRIALTAPLLSALAANAFFAVAYKNPDYVQACTLAAGLFIAPAVLGPALAPRSGFPATGRGPISARSVIGWAGVASLAFGAFLFLETVLVTSRRNDTRRQELSRIQGDLEFLAQAGVLPRRALIISPAHGIPYEWSNPFELVRPIPAYLDTGWITHSPPYLETLDAFDIASVPNAIIERDDVFLMSHEDFTPFLSRYYQEHYDKVVEFEAVYRVPNRAGWPGNDHIFLYRVRPIG